MKPSILFISTHNLATNPRLVKEVELALKNDYEVSVLCCSFEHWSKTINERIKEKLTPQIRYYEVPGNRKPYLPWLLSSFYFSFAKIALNILPKNTFLLSLASNKRSWLLLKYLKRINEPLDLIVAHNPGSFYPAMKLAKKRGIPFGIDLEDYHPGETNNSKGTRIMEELMRAILPSAAYVSVASDPILSESLRIVPFDGTVVLNYFSEEEFIPPTEKSGNLQLVWFSQNISFNRGLEIVIPVIEELDNVELHLYGNCNDSFKSTFLMNLQNVFLHGPLPQEELHKRLSEYDVGLAIEPGKDLNNDLAVSNKILAYYQAGLFILASNTRGQEDFLNNFSCHGRVIDLQSGLKRSLSELIAEKKEIRKTANNRYNSAKTHGWNKESEKIKTIWESIIAKRGNNL